MSLNKKTRKNLIIASVTAVLVVGFALGLWFFVQYQSDQKTVEVQPVSYLSTSYWGDTTYSSGTAASDSTQEIYPSTEQTISDIYVTEGQQVSVGDPLLQYDKTKLELDVEAKDIAVKQAEIELDDAEDELKKLRNTTPVSTPRPTRQPTATPRPTQKPSSTPAPTPTPAPTATPAPTVPPADVTVYRRLDVDSKPYAGSGTTEDPYMFLCTEDCVLTPEFLLRLLGDGSTPSPDDVLATPFAATFEVREGNSNYGELLYSFTLDGTDLSGGFQMEDVLAAGDTLESVAEVFEARNNSGSKATPTPTPSNDYDDMGYTKEELQKLIQDQRQKIKDLELKVKQAELDLEKSKVALENSTVRSTVDGVVRTLLDADTAAANSQPLLVVAGQGQFTIKGTISESLLTSIHVGDVVSAMSYENGMSYTATISEISTYPLEGSYYNGTGNPNSSTYEFTAVVDNPEGLSNGMYLDITLSTSGNVSVDGSSDALYLDKAYIREDEGGSYVMKSGIDNRLYKQYLELGATIYSGNYVEIISGLTVDDYIAFPYGTDVKEGVRVVVEGTGEPPMAEDSGGSSSSLVEDGTESAEGAEGTESSLEADGGNGAVLFSEEGAASGEDIVEADPEDGEASTSDSQDAGTAAQSDF